MAVDKRIRRLRKLADKPEDPRVRKLRRLAEKALANQRQEEAVRLLGKLCEADPRTPRWPHKRGDLLRSLGQRDKAVQSYAAAVDLYAELGFIARAVAMAKTVLSLDATRVDILERVDPEAARQMHRDERPQGASLAPVGLQHPMIVPDHAPTPRAHPTVVDAAPATPQFDVEPPPLPELPGATPAAAPRRRRHPSLDDLSLPPPRPTRMQNLPPSPTGVPDLVIPGTPALPGGGGRPLLTDAPPLEIAPDLVPGETRFSNAPRQRAISVDLSDIEFEARSSVPVDDDRALEPARPTARKLSHLPLFPLFAELPKQALQHLMREAELVELADGALVVRKGDEADSLYGIVEGSVQVSVPGHQIKHTLAEGDVIGEACLLPGERRQADVVVAGRLVALRVRRETLESLIHMHPGLAELLLELLTRRLLGNLLHASPLFQELDTRGRREVAQQFEVRRAPAGMRLAERGKRMDGLYITLTGQVTVGDAGEVVECGPGSMFGQRGLVTGEPSSVTIETNVNMLVLRLPTERFTQIAMQYPSILAHVSELASTTVARAFT